MTASDTLLEQHMKDELHGEMVIIFHVYVIKLIIYFHFFINSNCFKNNSGIKYKKINILNLAMTSILLILFS